MDAFLCVRSKFTPLSIDWLTKPLFDMLVAHLSRFVLVNAKRGTPSHFSWVIFGRYLRASLSKSARTKGGDYKRHGAFANCGI